MTQRVFIDVFTRCETVKDEAHLLGVLYLRAKLTLEAYRTGMMEEAPATVNEVTILLDPEVIKNETLIALREGVGAGTTERAFEYHVAQSPAETGDQLLPVRPKILML